MSVSLKMAELRAEESGEESGDDLADVEHGQQAGKREYLQKCAELGIVASSTLIAKLDAEYIVRARALRAH